MNARPQRFERTRAIRKSDKQRKTERAAAVAKAEDEPPLIPAWAIPPLSGLLMGVIIVFAAFFLKEILRADTIARAQEQPFEAGYAIPPQKKGPIFSWLQIRRMTQPWNNWPCVNQFCTVDAMVKLERFGWRSLHVANEAARAKRQEQTIDRDDLVMLDSGWFSWTDNTEENSLFVYLLPPTTGHPAGTDILACATQRVAADSSPIENYAIGDVSANQQHCWPAILSWAFPDPRPKKPLTGAVSEGLWRLACARRGRADCGDNPLTEWIIYKEIEQ